MGEKETTVYLQVKAWPERSLIPFEKPKDHSLAKFDNVVKVIFSPGVQRRYCSTPNCGKSFFKDTKKTVNSRRYTDKCVDCMIEIYSDQEVLTKFF